VRRFIQISLALFAFSMIALALSRSPDANASSAYASAYTYEQTFGTVLRLIRVDLGMKIVEKDKDLGYVLFEYTSPESGNRVSNGSVSLVTAKNGTQVSVQLPQMPRYHEQMILDALAKKLEEEHGAPPKPEAPADKEKEKEKEKERDKNREHDRVGEGKDKDKAKDGESDKKSSFPSAAKVAPLH
jgi:hypothetical protein